MTATATALANRFEFEDCTRCGGTGHYSFNLMEGTRCRRCRGRKRTITRRGNAAYTRWKEQIDARLTTPVLDLEPGDVVYSDAEQVAGSLPVFFPTRWRTVVRVERTDHGDSATLTVVFKATDPAGRQIARTLPADQLDAFALPRMEATVLDEINRKIARRFTGAWLSGEEPPAPAVRRPRAQKTPEERKAAAHQLRTLEREAEALDAGPLKEEAAAFLAAPGSCAAAANLIERVTAEVAAQRQRLLDRQRYAGAIGERVAVRGTVVRRRSGSWGVLLVVQDDAEEVRALAFLSGADALAVEEGARVTLAGTVVAHQTDWSGQAKETKLNRARLTRA
ncbi:hypothetical protein [Streptomyces pseudogriseolus]|uniref:hypothetical protein n=1 Tax=Streptomyces pseudogriseolus TaxID=36817 RepID=UPI003FA34215